MHDQWIEARPALGFVNTRDRFRVGCIGGKAIDRLSRHSDRLAGQHQPRRLSYGVI